MISRSPPADAADADAALLPLMLWLSPAFPVGSFAYSQGLEWVVENGDMHDARSLGGWLVELLTFGAPRADAILFAECFRAAEAEDWKGLAEANAFAIALANSAERRLETTAQGHAFVLAAFGLEAVHNYFRSHGQSILGDAAADQGIRAAAFKSPIDHRSVRIFHIHPEPRVRVHQFYLGHHSPQDQRLIGIKGRVESVMRDRRRSGQKNNETYDR